MAFNKCHTRRCAINAKSSLANCTCGFTAKSRKETIKRLRIELRDARTYGEFMSIAAKDTMKIAKQLHAENKEKKEDN